MSTIALEEFLRLSQDERAKVAYSPEDLPRLQVFEDFELKPSTSESFNLSETMMFWVIILASFYRKFGLAVEPCLEALYTDFSGSGFAGYVIMTPHSDNSVGISVKLYR